MSDIVEYLRSDYCSCLDAYKDRGRIDPQCESCNTKDERTAAADLIDALKEQNAVLTKNSARYLWLRDIGDATWTPIIKRGYGNAISPEQCDANIDVALTAHSDKE